MSENATAEGRLAPVGPAVRPGGAAEANYPPLTRTPVVPGPKPGAADGDKPKWTPPPIPPTAGAALLRKRHFGLMASFVAVVLAPVLIVALYMTFVAVDQYSSVTGFTVRQEEGGGASDFIGGIAQLTGSSASSDGDILYEFILSQNLVQDMEEAVGLVEHYGSAFPGDPAFALWPDPSIEDLVDYWSRVVRISHDSASGLIEVEVLAFTPDKAQQIAREIVQRSQNTINALNEQARADATRYALADLDEAVARLRTAREALTAFRSRTQIVDPSADIQGRMGVMNNLQQQLAEALIEVDLLRDTTNAGDPRLVQAQRRIEVIRQRIAEERRSFANEDSLNGTLADDYPSLIAEYEGLVVDREFAEETYRAALAAVDVARANAQRQSRYLATYVQPTLSQTSQYPQRLVIVGLAALFLLLAWGTMALVYYSIRDRG